MLMIQTRSAAVTFLILALMSLSAPAVWAGRWVIHGGQADLFLKENLNATLRSVSCPTIEAVTGGTFVCKIVLADGIPGTVTVHMTNGTGAVVVNNSDIRLADIIPSKVEAFLFGYIAPKPRTVTCPSGIKPVKGGTFDCDLVLANGVSATVTVHMTDAIGDVNITKTDIHPRG
jgi:hypothetical protein